MLREDDSGCSSDLEADGKPAFSLLATGGRLPWLPKEDCIEVYEKMTPLLSLLCSQ